MMGDRRTRTGGKIYFVKDETMLIYFKNKICILLNKKDNENFQE